MTRFARAKGSKASNERVPEESTPWSQMKQQLLERQTDVNEKDKRKEFEALRQENYNKFLKELSNKSEESSWADFPESSNTSKSEKKNLVKTKQFETEIKTPKVNKKSKSKQLKNDSETTNTDVDESPVIKKQKKEKKHQKSKVSKIEQLDAKSKKKDQSETEIQTPKINKKSKSKQVKNDFDATNTDIDESPVTKKQKTEKKQPTEKSKVSKIEKLDAKSKKIKKAKNKNSDIDAEIAQMCKNLDPEMKSRYKSLKALIEEKLQEEIDLGNEFEEILLDEDSNNEDEELETKDVQNGAQVEPGSNNEPNKNKKDFVQKTPKSQKVKDKNSNEYSRRKLDDKKEYIYMNGEKEELVKFDGFPIKKSDADRLKSLKKDMISKGIPQSEIHRTLKLERRRAEKALARFRKQVCFHCRKSGHLLSSCPDLNSESGSIETSAIGICFKCGSTEHTHINCKVTKKDDFKFAECFICKEQGHISRQCPDNPRGLYPTGGSCRLCGDVTHLKKDCPRNMQEKADQQFTLDVISDNIEMEGSDEQQRPKIKQAKQRKIIKF